MTKNRKAQCKRSTKETKIEVVLNIDGRGEASASTGIPFFDHMLEQLGKHARFDLSVKAEGDLEVDLHGDERPSSARRCPPDALIGERRR